MASDSENPPDVCDPSQDRKLPPRIANHKRSVAKYMRNKGMAYISPSSQCTVHKRVIGAPCKDGCFSKVTMPGVQSIFASFWAIGNYDMQNAYIQQQVLILPIARKRTAAEVSRRSVTRLYTVTYDGKTTKVCLSAFLAIHAISKKRLTNAIRKVSNTIVPEPDLRGRHVPANKLTGEKAKQVREHIHFLSVVTNHYSRTEAPNRFCLDSTLTIKKLYDLYLSWMGDTYPQSPRAAYHYYRDVFTKEFNIGFAPPKVDTRMCYKLLDFTADHENPLESFSSIDHEPQNSQPTEEDVQTGEPELEDKDNQPEKLSNITLSSPPSKPPIHRLPKRKKCKIDNLVEQALSVLCKPYDECDIFARHVSTELRAMNDSQRAIAKQQISQIIFKGRMNQLSE